MAHIQFLRRTEVAKRFSIVESTSYLWQYEGFIVKPVLIGMRRVGFPKHEIDAIFEARMQGATSDEIRALVKRLEASRAFGLAAVPDEPERSAAVVVRKPKLVTVGGWTRAAK